MSNGLGDANGDGPGSMPSSKGGHSCIKITPDKSKICLCSDFSITYMVNMCYIAAHTHGTLKNYTVVHVSDKL